MRKFLLVVARTILCLVVICCVSACSKDNEPSSNGGLNAGGSGDIADVTGLALTSVNSAKIYYDEKGRVEGYRDSDGDRVSIDYGQGTITCDYGDEDESGKIKFNKKGYISEISNSWSYKDYDEGSSESGTSTISFSYDEDGHLIKISGKSNGTYKEDGETSKYSSELSTTLTWRSGNLVRTSEIAKESEGGEVYNSRYDYNIEYGYKENPFLQVPYGLWNMAVDCYDIFGSTGLFGVGTKNLPESVTCDYDDDGYDGSYDYSFSYSLNKNGTISEEHRSRSTYSYGYNYIDTRSSDNGLSLKTLMNNPLRKSHRSKYVK